VQKLSKQLSKLKLLNNFLSTNFVQLTCFDALKALRFISLNTNLNS